MQPQLFRFSKKCLTESQHPLHTERDVRRYTCPVGVSEIINGTEFTNSSFNEGKRSDYTCSNSGYCYLAICLSVSNSGYCYLLSSGKITIHWTSSTKTFWGIYWMILSTFGTTGAWTQQRITATGCDIPNSLSAYSLPPSRTKELLNLDFFCLKKMLPVGLEIGSSIRSIRLNHTFDYCRTPFGVCGATRNWREGKGNTMHSSHSHRASRRRRQGISLVLHEVT